MKTPIKSIDQLPPIVTFYSSHYEIGFSFPLAVGIFVNGKSYSFFIKPTEPWKNLDYDERYTGGTPIEFFDQHGLEIEFIQQIILKLIGDNPFTLYLRDDYDPRFFYLLGLEHLPIRDVNLVDTFKNYDERFTDLMKRMKEEDRNIYSVEDVVITVAEQTLENLKYPALEDLIAACEKHIQI